MEQQNDFYANISDIMHHKEKMIQCQAKAIKQTNLTRLDYILTILFKIFLEQCFSMSTGL